MLLGEPYAELKLGSMATIFVLSVGCCYVPWVVKKKFRRHSGLIMSYFNCLAGGVVLGALLMHMIPEMFHDHDHHHHEVTKVKAQSAPTLVNLPNIRPHANHHHDHSGCQPSSNHSHGHGNCQSHCQDHSHADTRREEDAPAHHSEEHGHNHDRSHDQGQTEAAHHRNRAAHHHSHGHSHGEHDHHHHHGHAHSDENDESSNTQPRAQEATQESSSQATPVASAQASRPASGCCGHNHGKSAAANAAQPDHHDHDHGFAWGSLFAGTSFLFLLAVDRLLMHAHSHDHEHHHHAADHKHHHHQQVDEKGMATGDKCCVEGPEVDDCASCHSEDLMGGCHMDGITSESSGIQALVFVIALSMHSFMEGLGLATKNSQEGLSSFLISLFAHKWLEAFALGVNVMNGRFSPLLSLALITFYASLTPIGGILSMILQEVTMKGPYADVVIQALNGLAVGSFFFASCIEMIPPEFHKKTKHTIWKFLILCIGFAAMAGISVLHSH